MTTKSAKCRIPLKNKIDVALRVARPGTGPLFASLFVTRKCNCNCSYCRSIRQPFIDISLDEWKKIIDRLFGWGVRIFPLTGGEPLVRPDIADIVSYITKRKRGVCWMISNFKSMDMRMVDVLHSAGLQFITCSLDSLEENGDKSSGRVFDTLQYARSKGMVASTLTVVTENNIRNVPDLAREVVSRGIIFDMGLYQHVGGAFSPSDTEQKPRSMAQVKRLMKFLRNLKITAGLVSPSMSYLMEDIALYDKMGWKCPADSDRFLVVNNDGTLMPCQEYAGNVHVLDIDTLSDARWRESKRAVVQSCKGCFYGCYYQKCRITALDALFDAYTLLRT